MFCKNCGKEISEGTRFCPGCGAEQNSAPVENNAPVNVEQPTVNLTQPQPKKKLSTGIIVGIVVAVIVVVVIAVSMGSRDDNENYIPTISPIEDSTYDFGFEDAPIVGTVPQTDAPVQTNPIVQQTNPVSASSEYEALLAKYGYTDLDNLFGGLSSNSYAKEEELIEGVNNFQIQRFGYTGDKISDVVYTFVFDISGMTEQEAAQFEYEIRMGFMDAPMSYVEGCCSTTCDFGDTYVAVTTTMEGVDKYENCQKLAAAGWSDFNFSSAEYLSMAVTDGNLIAKGFVKK